MTDTAAPPVKTGPITFGFTNRTLRTHLRAALIKDSSPARYTPQDWGNSDIEGVSAHLSKKGKVSFYLRAWIDRVREHESLGPWIESEFSTVDLQRAVNKQLAEWHSAAKGVRQERVESIPTLNEFIDIYEADRIRGDWEGRCRKGNERKHPEHWDNIKTQLRATYRPLLSTPLDRLTRKSTKDAENAYLEQRQRQKGKRVESSVRTAKAYLRIVLLHGIVKKYVVASEFLTMKVGASTRRHRYLLPGEWQLIAPALDKLPRNIGLFIRFLMYCGVRKSMAQAMKWEDVREETFHDGGEPRKLLVWTVLNERMLTDKEDAEDEEDSAGLKGMEATTIPIVGHAKRIYDQLCALCPDEGDNRRRQPTVFPKAISGPWCNNFVANKRGYGSKIKELSGVDNWQRHDCRRTTTTYKQWLGRLKGEIQRGLSHAEGDRHMATAADNYMVADPFIQLIEGYERVQELFDDMEHGRLSDVLKNVQWQIGISPKAKAMIKRFKLNPELAKIKERIEPMRPTLVA